ncbi:MAG: MFS transporter [Acidimicrobiaceae bacterium]|nr:MFS transporter [Acidimicrobiaceae bacterium]
MSGVRSTFSVFKHRDYRLFWIGGVISNIGRWFQTIAVPIVIYDLTGSAGWVGLAGFAQIMPMALMGPLGGAIADRYPRRKVLIVTQMLQAVTAGAMMTMWFSGIRAPGAYVAMSVVVGLTAGLNLPAWQAIVSDLLPRDKMLEGITLNSAQFNASRMIGPALGGIAIGAWGPGWAFFVNLVTYGAVLMALVMMDHRSEPPPPDGRMQPLREFVAAARYAAGVRGIRTAIAAVSMVAFFGLSMQTLAVTIAEDVFDRGERGFGLMLSCVGLGAVLTSPVVASIAGRIRRSRIQEVALIQYASGYLLIAFAPWFGLALVGSFIVGSAHLMSASTLNTAIQLQVDEAIRAKVLAVYLSVLTFSNPAGQLILGQLIDATNPRTAYALAGSAFIMIALWLAFRGHLEGLDSEGGRYEPASIAEVHPSTPAPPKGYQPSPNPVSSPSDK